MNPSLDLLRGISQKREAYLLIEEIKNSHHHRENYTSDDIAQVYKGVRQRLEKFVISDPFNTCRTIAEKVNTIMENGGFQDYSFVRDTWSIYPNNIPLKITEAPKPIALKTTAREPKPQRGHAALKIPTPIHELPKIPPEEPKPLPPKNTTGSLKAKPKQSMKPEESQIKNLEEYAKDFQTKIREIRKATSLHNIPKDLISSLLKIQGERLDEVIQYLIEQGHLKRKMEGLYEIMIAEEKTVTIVL